MVENFSLVKMVFFFLSHSLIVYEVPVPSHLKKKMDCLMGTFNPGTNDYNQGLGGPDTSGQMGILQIPQYLDALFHGKSHGKPHTEMDELGGTRT